MAERKNYSDLGKHERDRRWAESHQTGVEERKQALLSRNPRMSEAAAYSEADRQQTQTTNRARANYRRADGKD